MIHHVTAEEDFEDHSDLCNHCVAPICGDCTGCCCPDTPCRCDEPHRGGDPEEGVNEPLPPAPADCEPEEGQGWASPPSAGGWGTINPWPQETA